ncbi:hypothetical protein KHA80_09200 [Anaerobacillus sp. HL2]|nr:hypothetical protein KHA80_09200 [Anaerobacillus sp. HL2]
MWLQSITNKDNLSKVNEVGVISQKEWANQQLKEIISTNKNSGNIILTNPWHKKYLTSFYIPRDCQLYLIDPLSEHNLYKFQYNFVVNNNSNYELQKID